MKSIILLIIGFLLCFPLLYDKIFEPIYFNIFMTKKDQNAYLERLYKIKYGNYLNMGNPRNLPTANWVLISGCLGIGSIIAGILVWV